MFIDELVAVILFYEDVTFDLALRIFGAFVDLEEEFDEELLSIAVWFYAVVILALIVVKFVGIYSPS